MVDRWSTPFPAAQGEEERSVYVYVPDAFDTDNKLRFPVLYMFDGHNLFKDDEATYGKSWGLKEYLDKNQIPLIVVGVECNHHPDNGRLSEYSPFSFTSKRFGRVEGRGDATMCWYTQVLKPMIDKLYPTLPDRQHTFIGGSSMGGLMSLYAVLRYNNVYSRAAALSPSLWVAPLMMDALMRTANLQAGTVVYMDYGQKEMRGHRHMGKMFSAAASRLMDRRVLLTSRIVPGGEHNEATWEKQLPFMISTLLYKQN